MRKLNPERRHRNPVNPEEVSLYFERMEPKILFSADALGGLVSVDPLDDNDSARSTLDLDQSARLLTDIYAPTSDHDDRQDSDAEQTPLQLEALQAVLQNLDPANDEATTNETLETFLDGSVTSTEQRQELIFVDAATPDYEQLLNAVNTSSAETAFQIFVLQSDRDGIEQISEILAGFDSVDAMHLVSHGNETGFQLGNTWLDQQALSDSSELLSGWASMLQEDADILIYGCNLAAAETGLRLIDDLAGLTGADVAASTDLTGDADQGGDWELEHEAGQVESEVAFSAGAQTAWKGLLLNTGTAIWTDMTTAPKEVVTEDWDGSNFSGSTGSGSVADHYRIMQGAEAPDRDEKSSWVSRGTTMLAALSGTARTGAPSPWHPSAAP